MWALLRLDRAPEALEQAEVLAGAPPRARFAHAIVGAARRYATLTDDEAAAALVATLPVLTRAEAAQLNGSILSAGPWRPRADAAQPDGP